MTPLRHYIVRLLNWCNGDCVECRGRCNDFAFQNVTIGES
jgi:hypothetical protein